MLELVKKDDGSPWMKLPTEAQIRFNFMPTRHFASDGMIESNIMPNITHLTLIHDSVCIQNYERVIQLLRRWSLNLISLRLTLLLVNENENSGEFPLRMVLAFFEQLNNIPTLRHLTLKISSPGFLESEVLADGTNSLRREWIFMPDNFSLSFLSHLHTFCFQPEGIKQTYKCHLSSLREHATGNANLKMCYHDQLYVDKLWTLDSQLATKFIDIPACDAEDMSVRFFTRFASLTSLILHIPQPYMTRKLSQNLKLLPNLVSLSLDYGRLDPYCRRSRVEWDDPLGQHEPNYCQVASVRLLEVHVNSTCSHCDIAKLCLPDMFPAVQVLHFTDNNFDGKCSTCDYRLGRFFRIVPDKLDPTLISKVKECVRMGRAAFRAFSKLHTFYYLNSRSINACLEYDINKLTH